MKALLSILLISLFSLSAVANNKVGYIDMKEAVKETKAGKAAFKKLKKIQTSKQGELDKRKKSIENEQKELEKKFRLWSQEEKVKKQQEFQKKVMQAEEFFRGSQVELVKKEQELLKPILDGLRNTISSYAKKEGYAMIVDKTMVLYGTDSVDVTSKIVKAYGK